MNEQALVSVVMCTYNDEKFISEAIESILSQTYKKIEFIIVNDGSTDNTKNVILSFDDSRIKYLEHKRNQGQETSKNFGISKANGKYIAFMDGDDISLEERLEAQVDFMETHEDIGICGTCLKAFGDENFELIYPEKDKEINFKALLITPLPHPTCMIRKEVLDRNNIRYEKGWEAAEDYYFMSLILEKTKAYCIQKILYLHRWHGNNISVRLQKSQKDNARRMSQSMIYKKFNLRLKDEEIDVLQTMHIYGGFPFQYFNIVEQLFFKLKKYFEAKKSPNQDVLKVFLEEISKKVFMHLMVNAHRKPTRLLFYFKSEIWKYLLIRQYGLAYAKFFIISILCSFDFKSKSLFGK
ncbi:MAG: glycosyltransferase family 2 protein [Saprospiraceae bacterium]